MIKETMMLSSSISPRHYNRILRSPRTTIILLASLVIAISLIPAGEAFATPATRDHKSINEIIPTSGSSAIAELLPDFYRNPISNVAYQARKALKLEKPGPGPGKVEARNFAVGFIDISAKTGDSTTAEIERNFKNRLREYEEPNPKPEKYRSWNKHPFANDVAKLLHVIDVVNPSPADTLLVKTLKENGILDSQAKKLLVLPVPNSPNSEYAKQPVLHSEIRIRQALLAMGFTVEEIATSLVAVYTERPPCLRCAPKIPTSAKVLTSVNAWEDALALVRDAQNEYNTALWRLKHSVLKKQAQKEVDKAKSALSNAVKYRDNVQSLLKSAGQSTPDIPGARTAEEQISAALSAKYQQELEDGNQLSPKQVERNAEKAKAEVVKQQEMLSQPNSDCLKPGEASRLGSRSNQVAEMAAWSTASPCSGDKEGEGTPGALVKALESSNLGGVDFSALQMRYMSDSPGSGGLQYSFSGPRVSSGTRQNIDSALGVLTNSAADLRTWLVLSPDKFWVNLNPSEPDRIIDPRMGETDAGKAMLQADLQLKTTSAKIIDPRTPLGAEYWRVLEGPAQQICYGSRMWIVPGEVQVREDGGSLYILKAKLAVKAVPDHVAAGDSRCHYNAAIDARGERLDDAIVVPRVTKAVNTAPEYAAIRRAFMARIVAQWIRDRHERGQRTSFDKLIDSGNIGPARLQDGWEPRQVFDTYVHQLKSGLFTYKTTTHQGGYIITQTTTVGGVDFTGLHPTAISAAQMDKQYPRLAQTAKASTRTLAGGPDGTMWLGDTIVPPVTKHASAGSSSGSSFITGRTGVLILIVAVLGVVVFRVRRSSRRRHRT